MRQHMSSYARIRAIFSKYSKTDRTFVYHQVPKDLEAEQGKHQWRKKSWSVSVTRQIYLKLMNLLQAKRKQEIERHNTTNWKNETFYYKYKKFCIFAMLEKSGLNKWSSRKWSPVKSHPNSSTDSVIPLKVSCF